MRIRFAFVSIAAASFLAMGAPAMAAAGSTADIAPRASGCTTDGDCAGAAAFHKQGDKLIAADQKADGYGVYVKYEREDSSVAGEFRNTKGNGTGITKNMDLKEGSEIRFYVCLLGSDNDTSSCSAWIHETA